MSQILLDPGEPVRFQPRDGGPVYFLRVPRVVDRARYRHAIRAAGGRQWSHLDLATTVEQGISALLEGDENAAEREGYLGLLREHMAHVEAALALWRADQIDENWQAVIAAMKPERVVEEIWRIIEAEYAPLRERLADNNAFPEIAGLVAARMFLRGWEGHDTAFRTKMGEVPDDVLDCLSSIDLVHIGRRIGELLEPGQARMGNLSSGSTGESDQKPSNGSAGSVQSAPVTTTASPSNGSASLN